MFCLPLDITTTGQDIFNKIEDYFEKNNILWDNLTSVTTDGAAAMTGRFSGLVAQIKKSTTLHLNSLYDS